MMLYGTKKPCLGHKEWFRRYKYQLTSITVLAGTDICEHSEKYKRLEFQVEGNSIFIEWVLVSELQVRNAMT